MGLQPCTSNLTGPVSLQRTPQTILWKPFGTERHKNKQGFLFQKILFLEQVGICSGQTGRSSAEKERIHSLLKAMSVLPTLPAPGGWLGQLLWWDPSVSGQGGSEGRATAVVSGCLTHIPGEEKQHGTVGHHVCCGGMKAWQCPNAILCPSPLPPFLCPSHPPPAPAREQTADGGWLFQACINMHSGGAHLPGHARSY